MIVKRDVSRKVASYLLEHKMSFPGVEIQKNYLRSYPHGSLAAHVLGNLGEVTKEQLKTPRFKGYVAGDVIGQGGLEWTYDSWLRGKDGASRIEVDALGQPKRREPLGNRLPESGNTLVTTIDAGVQESAEKALERGIRLARSTGSVGANGGAAVVLDARNGQVIAMASNPTFKPSEWVGGISEKNYKKLAAPRANHPLLNRVTQSARAVGSTFKAIDAVAALEEGVVTTSTTFFCNGRYIAPHTSDNRVFHCWDRSGHGTVDLISAMSCSCDTYFYNVGYSFYQRKGTELADWAKRLGMGEVTGVDIPGEVAGRIPTPSWKRSYFKTEVDKIWNPGDSILLAIGQGNLEATPLQLAVSYAAVANGGTIVTPHLGLKIVDSQGELVHNLEPKNKRKVEISQETLQVVRAGLRRAASDGTSAGTFAGYPIAVAGKTGTAEVWDDGRYVDYAWYASYAPIDKPKYVIVTMIEKGGHGGTTAAPITRLIYDQLFHIKSKELGNSGSSD